MADIYSPQKRSDIMSKIRSSGTKPEEKLYIIIVSILGKHRKILKQPKLLGKPDILIPSLNVVIFADGCFFHGCPIHGHIPKSNNVYWAPKIENNILRDRRNRRKLRGMGYHVWSFWEHDIQMCNNNRLISILTNRLKKMILG